MHVSFGHPLQEGLRTPKQVADAIDQQIINLYKTYPTNHMAYYMLHNNYPISDLLKSHQNKSVTRQLKKQQSLFKRRINMLPKEHRKHALWIYAAIIEQKKIFKENVRISL